MKIGNSYSSFGRVSDQKTLDLPASAGVAAEIDCTLDLDAQIAINVDVEAVCTFAVNAAGAVINFVAGNFAILKVGGTSIPIVGETRNLYIKRRDGILEADGLSYSLVESTN